MNEHAKKSTVSRRVYIIDQLNTFGQVDVAALSKALDVSEVTIRNDLGKLEEQHVLIRARGGAIKVDRVGTDFSLSDKNKQHLEEKKRVGQAAAALVREGETIILDSGTTTMEIARNLQKSMPVTVITNAINIVNQLNEHENVNIIVPGGVLRKKSQSLVGTTAEESFKNYHCDKLFLAVDGFDPAYGISTPNLEEAHINRVMIDISYQVIVVTDSSKFRKRCLAFIAPVSKIHMVITDNRILPDDQKKLENAGIKVIIV
ncbi:DeoR/GlpR transcriptional regulator [Chitinophaga alhagiae]|uniref:DeoR/GlpR transcriptional regulator n=1 Tax=Chitinophaga alhagiae TaxID=2203219 RepID=A0ABM6WA84_9BACT|nr:transcriptional repressor AgaR [Chitinophaga alhagiae]AWO00871.1 DeoR/GlpR transcriptional regulator [Chitinophaga alhagiae]